MRGDEEPTDLLVGAKVAVVRVEDPDLRLPDSRHLEQPAEIYGDVQHRDERREVIRDGLDVQVALDDALVVVAGPPEGRPGDRRRDDRSRGAGLGGLAGTLARPAAMIAVGDEIERGGIGSSAPDERSVKGPRSLENR